MKTFKKLVSALAISLSIVGCSGAMAQGQPVNGEYFTVGKLINAHTSTGDVNRGFVLGYFAGLHDTIIGRVSCMPAGMTLGEFADGMMTILIDHERKGNALRSDNAAMLVSMVLAEAFPCTKKGKNV
jgi:hypothetical protein